MTACMIATNEHNSADGLLESAPIIIADTMATSFPSAHQVITPANRTYNLASDPTRVSLVRKLYNLNDHCVVAFAGNDDRRIVQCLQAAVADGPNWSNDSNPIEGLIDLVSWHEGVSIVGFRVDGESLQSVTSGQDFDSSSLGHCSAIGSGAQDLIHAVQGFDEARRTMPRVSPGQVAWEFSVNINAQCIAAEVIGAQRDWGVYLESAMYDGARWNSEQKHLHLLYRFQALKHNRGTIHAIPRMLAYDSGNLDGRIFSAVQSPGGHLIRDYTIENLLHRSLRGRVLPDRRYWLGWQPTTVSATLVIGKPGDSPTFVSQHFSRENLGHGLSFWIDGNQCDARLSNDEFHLFGKTAVERLGYVYEPATEENRLTLR